MPSLWPPRQSLLDAAPVHPGPIQLPDVSRGRMPPGSSDEPCSEYISTNGESASSW